MKRASQLIFKCQQRFQWLHRDLFQESIPWNDRTGEKSAQCWLLQTSSVWGGRGRNFVHFLYTPPPPQKKACPMKITKGSVMDVLSPSGLFWHYVMVIKLNSMGAMLICHTALPPDRALGLTWVSIPYDVCVYYDVFAQARHQLLKLLRATDCYMYCSRRVSIAKHQRDWHIQKTLHSVKQSRSSSAQWST